MLSSLRHYMKPPTALPARVRVLTFAFFELAALIALSVVMTASPLPTQIPVAADDDDGVEIDHTVWDPNPVILSLGRDDAGSVHDMALRFLVPDLASLQEIAFARLRFNSRGSQVPDGITFVISGVAEVCPASPSQERRPSTLTQTVHQVNWTVSQPWADGGANPLFYYSPDISPIINEILALPGWPGGAASLIVCLEDTSAPGSGPALVDCTDFDEARAPVMLEVCPVLEDAFDCHPLAVRPTDHSIAINFRPLVAIDACIEYGTSCGWDTTPVRVVEAGETCEIDLEGLDDNTAYAYRLRYRRAGTCGDYAFGDERAFHTQRARGSTFTFTAQADSHIWDYWGRWPLDRPQLALYRETLENVACDDADFHFELGDFTMTAYGLTADSDMDRYAVQRRFLDRALRGTAFFEVLGNHEGEVGWLRADNDSVPIWAERARHLLIPGPYPDGFYGGCTDSAASGPGYRESYCAWNWGDALFVILDPFWYTMEKPHHNGNPDENGGWAWTLGQEQYDWLYNVLRRSTRTWKIILMHQIVSGVPYECGNYGRGGIEVAKYDVAHMASFEWGGENHLGQDVFSSMRPGWSHGPIHDMLVETGVNLVIHGHDHFCALQELDGITYALVPQPMDPAYTYGCRDYGAYSHGTLLPNSGHLRFRVSPDDIVIEYVRAYLPGDGINQEVAAVWSVANGSAAVASDVRTGRHLTISPNPALGGAPVVIRALDAPDRSTWSAACGAQLSIFDATGRLCARPGRLRDGRLTWDQSGPQGMLPAGVYFCSMPGDGKHERTKLILAR
jgi:hypothetical protein